MSRNTKLEAEKTRAKILARGFTLFAKKGYERTTLNDIAAGLKMTKGAFYWHFKSKEELLIAIMKKAEDGLNQFLEKRLSSSPTFPEIARAMEEFSEIIVSNPKAVAFFKLMHLQRDWATASMSKVRKEFFEPNRPESFGMRKAFYVALQNDLKTGKIKKDTAIEDIACACSASWNGVIKMKIDLFLSKSVSEILRTIYSAIWESIKI
jgi:TetR/AcrR family acrAB operon transcriptional repressor